MVGLQDVMEQAVSVLPGNQMVKVLIKMGINSAPYLHQQKCYLGIKYGSFFMFLEGAVLASIFLMMMVNLHLMCRKFGALKKLSLKCTNVLLGYLNRLNSATNNIVFDNSIILGARYLL